MELTGEGAVVSYLYSDQPVGRFEFTASPRRAASIAGERAGGESPGLDPGERAEITVNMTGLWPALGANEE